MAPGLFLVSPDEHALGDSQTLLSVWHLALEVFLIPGRFFANILLMALRVPTVSVSFGSISFGHRRTCFLHAINFRPLENNSA